MTQEFKTLEEIKKEVAKENGFNDWFELSQETLSRSGIIRSLASEKKIVNKIAQRHAQQHIDANKELLAWKESMMKVHSELDLQKIGNALDMLVGTPIAPNVLPKILELKQSNKELVEMLEELHSLLEENQDIARFYTMGHHRKIEQLITKHKQS